MVARTDGPRRGTRLPRDRITAGSAGHLVPADPAVIRSLGSRVPLLGPSVRATILVEGVLLFDAELWLESGVLLRRGERRGARVRGVRRHVGVQYFAHDEDVLWSTQRVGAGENGVQHAVRKVTRGLIGTGSVEAPDDGLLAVGDDAGLATQLWRWLGSVNPDVLSLIRHGCSFKMSSRAPHDRLPVWWLGDPLAPPFC